MPTVGKGFSRDDIAAVEKFAEQVLKRERQIAVSTGISGSMAKAFFDTLRELRMERVRLEHAERSKAFNKS